MAPNSYSQSNYSSKRLLEIFNTKENFEILEHMLDEYTKKFYDVWKSPNNGEFKEILDDDIFEKVEYVASIVSTLTGLKMPALPPVMILDDSGLGGYNNYAIWITKPNMREEMFYNVYGHELYHHLSRVNGVKTKIQDEVHDPWLPTCIEEGIARVVQEDSARIISYNRKLPLTNAIAYGVILGELTTTFYHLSLLGKRKIPQSLGKNVFMFPYTILMDYSKPFEHSTGTSLIKLLQKKYGGKSYRKLINGDFTDLERLFS